MSKVKRITVSNLKAISNQSADFNGCTAIITGGNNKGKTTFLRSLPDRLAGVKPEMVLKTDQTEGFADWLLTTGERLRWEFGDNGKGFKEKLIYITEKEVKTALTVELRNKFMPPSFDVDAFLAAQPAAQKKMLQKLAGIDFTDIDTRYKAAYDNRESLNRRANEEKTVLASWTVPDKAEVVDITALLQEKETIRRALNTQYLENKKTNRDLWETWQSQCEDMRANVEAFNEEQESIVIRVGRCNDGLAMLSAAGYNDDGTVGQFIKSLKDSYQKTKEYVAPTEPTYIEELPDDAELKAIDEKIATATETNNKANDYANYLKQKDKYSDCAKQAANADANVKAIEKERMDLIKSAKMPEGFGFSESGIAYNGLPFTREQLSSSGIYIAALKLAAMNLGEVRVLHFDASFLDRASLESIEQWANESDLQLLIERPDFEGGEIEYQLINDDNNK